MSFKAANGRFPEVTNQAGNPPVSFLDIYLMELLAQPSLYFSTQLTETAQLFHPLFSPAVPEVGKCFLFLMVLILTYVMVCV